MQLERLISSILRQTTVLVARLSTSGGTRSPLAHVADQVFVGLVAELERQGVGKKVAADMFGLALRSFQLKVQRLQESASDSGITLWAAVRAFIEERGAATRADVLSRFARDDEASVRGILADLVDTGLCSRSGRGDASIYRIAPRADAAALGRHDDEAAAALVWLVVCRDGPLTAEAVAERTSLPPDVVARALESLLADGRAQRAPGVDATYGAERCLIPIGDAAGWEAAVLDHHQAVLNALAAKICGGNHASAVSDETGGGTFSFELWPGHPEELAVKALLPRLRADAAAVWERVSAHNRDARHGEAGRYNVSFYLGQHVRDDEGEHDEEA